MFMNLIIQCLLINTIYSISNHPILIIVSFDAFRYNYFDPNVVPNLFRLRNIGTYSDYLINVFPTKTFPNHHTIATGLYPEVHGVIGNSYYNITEKKIVHIGYEMFHFNEDIVPIWRRNEDLGNGRYSGVMMWPGGTFSYQSKNVTYSQKFQIDYDWFKRIDTIISWIKDPVKPANLLVIYFEEPDTHGHAFGPNSEIVKDLLVKLDNITRYLEEQLEINGLTDKVNVIHLSDHGMCAVTPSKFINVTQYLQPNTYEIAGTSPILQFIPKSGADVNALYNRLEKGSKINGHFKVYRKENYPDRWHYKNNPRTAPIVVMADVGYALDDMIIAAPGYAKTYNFTFTPTWEFGVHGYDYIEKEMHPFFMARGPKIKTNNKIQPFNTVDLYNLFCEILGMTPPIKNNGSMDVIEDILINNGNNTQNNNNNINGNNNNNNTNGKYSLSAIIITTVVGVILAIFLICCAAIITLMLIKRQQNITTTQALNKRFPQTFQSSIEAQHLLEPEEA